MSGETLQRRVTITNPQGFHLRPQSAFVQRANQFQGSVKVRRNDQCVDGKSQWELLSLVAEEGSELTIEVSGLDAAPALEALATIMAAPAFDEPPEPPVPKKG